jgi:hypothetical protein
MKNRLFISNSYLVVVFCFLLVQSCGTDDLALTGDRNYPTTLKKMDIEKLHQMRTDFAIANPFLITTISDFGFCGIWANSVTPKSTTRIPDLSREEAINAVKSFITMNSILLGVKNVDEVTFARIDSSVVYDGSVSWHLLSNFQKYDGLEILDTNLNFVLMNGQMTYSAGNWYPTIYVPSRINIDEVKVKSKLLNKIVYLSDFAGKQVPITITTKSLETTTIYKCIYPVKNDDNIELHVIWRVNIPDVFYVVFLDVMTGTIVGGYPTIVS